MKRPRLPRGARPRTPAARRAAAKRMLEKLDAEPLDRIERDTEIRLLRRAGKARERSYVEFSRHRATLRVLPDPDVAKRVPSEMGEILELGGRE